MHNDRADYGGQPAQIGEEMPHFVFCGHQAETILFFLFFFIYAFSSRDYNNPRQLIQIYSVDWTDVYDTYNIEHRTEPVSH